MSGPPPKPAHLRQRTNRKATSAQLAAQADDFEVPEIPNPDQRVWHPLTLQAWERAWRSPMSTQWLETDVDALGRLAVLWDLFYQVPHREVLAEIRLQEQRFGLSPLDRSRLQWEVARADEAGQKTARRAEVQRKRTGTHDPRHILSMVKS